VCGPGGTRPTFGSAGKGRLPTPILLAPDANTLTMSRRTLLVGRCSPYAEESPMNDIASAENESEARDEIPSPDDLVEADDLVEELSIDGMCGVY
jgi:mycofactocin precursor